MKRQLAQGDLLSRGGWEMRSTRFTLVAAILALAAAPDVSAAQPRDSTPTIVTREDAVDRTSSDSLSFGLRTISPIAVDAFGGPADTDRSDQPSVPAFPIEFMLVGLATAKRAGTKTAAKKGAGKKNVGDSVSSISPKEPPAAPPLTAAQKAAIETARTTEREAIAAARAPTADPKESENIKRTGKFDETAEGGRYKGADGKIRNAAGDVIDE